ncbi:4-hydroxybenzoate decarboxylase subunit C [Paenibacillus auburnensis]|uniref:4-hydroxybenzoate decarboxylase subunit C n=1 Tax=Paenibacillus auburnensis TaxID=2905649 RepID=A0ABM9CF72_9BACL|nr:UbiD family decarboxylase [Paenibacillus auburnensis]CAH1212299.1 4-hydroxybenzoate decarboxylase subunit C [Paenibacillus auburnensis]
MGYGNLRQWTEQLRKDKDLAVIETQVDPYLELPEIHRRVAREGGPALLFTNVKGTPFPVATNLFGTAQRVERAFGNRPEQLVKALMGAAETLLPPTLSSLWKEKALIFDLLKVGTKHVPQGEAAVLGVCRTSDPLRELPRVTSWQEAGGPYITLPLVYTESLSNPQKHNLGMHRIQIIDDSTAGIHWQKHKGAGLYHQEAETQGEALPVSVFIGGPPALIAAASAPGPAWLPDLVFASIVLGGKLPMVKDPLGGHSIPAEAEFALRGLVSPYGQSQAGALADYDKYNFPQHTAPVMHVQRMWHRKDAIYPATIAVTPREENYYLVDFLQQVLSPVHHLAMPSVHSFWTYSESGPDGVAAAVVQDSSPQDALGTAFRILGERQLSVSRFLLLTSEPAAFSDFPKLLETVLERFNPGTDLHVFGSTARVRPDSSERAPGPDSQAVIIGTGHVVRELPRTYTEGLLPGITEAIPYCGGCLIVSGASYEEDPELPVRLKTALRERNTAWPLVIMVDHAAEAIRTQTSFLWTVFTQFNPADDIYAEAEVKQHHIGYKLPIVIDARMKSGDDEEQSPCRSTLDLVDRNWNSYFRQG